MERAEIGFFEKARFLYGKTRACHLLFLKIISLRSLRLCGESSSLGFMLYNIPTPHA